MSTTQAFIVLVSIAVSTFGNLIGFGGGVFMVPLLVIAFGHPIQEAIGGVVTALVPAALMATLFNLRERSIHFLSAALLEPPTLIGAFAGSVLSAFLPVRALEFVFAAFVILLGVRMLRPATIQRGSVGLLDRLNALPPGFSGDRFGGSGRVGFWPIGLSGIAAGTAAGLFGIGGGFLKTPIMLRLLRLPAHKAVATSLFMIFFTSLTASYTHFRLGHLVPELAWPLAAGFTTGALVGQQLKRRLTLDHTERLVIAGLFLAGVSVLVHAWISL